MPTEVLQYLDPQPGEVIVDGTIGLGGHAKLIAEPSGPNRGARWDLNQDPAALAIARENLAFFTREITSVS